MNHFPHNPARALRLMDIAIDLETINPNTIIGMAIHDGLKSGSVVEVLEMIKEQAMYAPGMVADLIGYKTLNKIQKLSE